MTNSFSRIVPDLTMTYTPNSGAGTVTDTSNLPVELGTVAQSADGQKRYKFVLVEDQAAVVGQVACYTTDDNAYEISTKNGEGVNDIRQGAGLVVTAIADGDCGWIQTYGLSDADITTDGNVAAGEALIPHATTDGGVDSSTGTSVYAPFDIVGQALDADTGTTLAAGDVFLACQKG